MYVLYCNQPFGSLMMFRKDNVSSSHAKFQFQIDFRKHAIHPSRQTDVRYLKNRLIDNTDVVQVAAIDFAC